MLRVRANTGMYVDCWLVLRMHGIRIQGLPFRERADRE